MNSEELDKAIQVQRIKSNKFPYIIYRAQLKLTSEMSVTEMEEKQFKHLGHIYIENLKRNIKAELYHDIKNAVYELIQVANEDVSKARSYGPMDRIEFTKAERKLLDLLKY